MNTKIFFVISALLFGLIAQTPLTANAASDNFEVSGWIPYWATTKGTRDAKSHLDELTEINPFVYSVKQDGTLKDLGGLKKSSWKNLIKAAQRDDVRVVPTVMWSSQNDMQNVLSDPKLRAKHVKAIADMVKKGKYDGVDIDYEGKKSETKDFFSLFLKELKEKIGRKILSCTIEPRTPPDSLYRTVPAVMNYANDYLAIGQYCDTVKIMAYDQQRADLKLNDQKSGMPYIPVSDVDWARKVVAFALQTIPRGKIVLGFPTYGRQWQVIVSPNRFEEYRSLGSVNPPQAEDIADDADVEPNRNRAGELSFSYLIKSAKNSIPSNIQAPAGTPEGEEVAARALAYANVTGQRVYFNLVWWSDAEAVQQKINLAKEFGLRGVAMFKIDGEEDRGIWDILEDL